MTGLHTKTALFVALLIVAAAAPAASASVGRDRSTGRALQHAPDDIVAEGVPGAVLLVRERNRTIRLTSGEGKLKPKTRMRRPRPLPRWQHHEDVRRHRRPANGR